MKLVETPSGLSSGAAPAAARPADSEPRAGLSRRGFLAGTGSLAAISAAGSLALEAAEAQAADTSARRFVAAVPQGFAPLELPGKVVKVEGKGSFESMMQPNQLWPKADVARALLERALTELTGASNLVEALKRFVHPKDVVGLKVNGIAGQRGASMAYNYELVAPVVEALIALGVPPAQITVYEQYPSYLFGTRVGTPGHELPKGVKVEFHANRDVAEPETQVYRGTPTRYVRQLTQATALINMTQMKDHSICGYTGALKNMTHGNITNPQDHHAFHCNPQIAMLYNHPAVRSRVRLHLTDAFKIIYDQGPLDKNPKRRIPHGAVYASTDPVALDRVGWQVIDQARKDNGLPTLEAAGRAPGYIQTAAELGLGVLDDQAIRLRKVSV